MIMEKKMEIRLGIIDDDSPNLSGGGKKYHETSNPKP